MLGKPRSLVNLCVSALRHSIPGPIRKSVNNLQIPHIIKGQILMEDHSDCIFPLKRIDPLEYRDKHLNNQELCNSFLYSEKFNDSHKNCIDEAMNNYGDNFIFQYMYEEGPKFIPFIFFQFAGEREEYEDINIQLEGDSDEQSDDIPGGSDNSRSTTEIDFDDL